MALIIPTPSPSQNTYSPYYVYPSESLATVLVTPLLSGENYYHWARPMIMSLSSKNKIPFIDGSIQMPPRSDPIYPAWKRANNIVISWITRSVSPSISQSILWIDNAHEVWEELGEIFSQGNLIRIAELQESIANLRQGGLYVNNYFTELNFVG
ncbi:PREDICTED: uncharacterized protein LOC109339801 [Lupinus angustifolius]|uniref:uncharacterized protein LOC109339801 n=1 Tax=Lupinus angustifolius TaxID=3871 RepID=UPI00092E6085|nr:PREDICTED: uncharacterized protein LOC109339801 [Lupinus angustifolius]